MGSPPGRHQPPGGVARAKFTMRPRPEPKDSWEDLKGVGWWQLLMVDILASRKGPACRETGQADRAVTAIGTLDHRGVWSSTFHACYSDNRVPRARVGPRSNRRRPPTACFLEADMPKK
jgi:hypothetical protein